MTPNQITKTVYKCSDFLGWQRAGLLVLSPKFQRRPVWPPGAKSFLIDTICKGLPIPIIFLREQKTDLTSLQHRREVVDGQQRLRTVLSFLDPKSLADYNEARDGFTIRKTHNKELAGRKFGELPSEVRQRILDYDFSVHILPSSFGDREVVQIFQRMNATGYRLNDQELRNAQYFGEFRTCVSELSAEQLDRWTEWGVLDNNQVARMLEVELTSELVFLMLHGIPKKSQRSIDKIYQEFDLTFPHRTEVADRFRLVMDRLHEALGSRIQQTVFTKKAPFYALFATFYELLFGLESPLTHLKPKTMPVNLTERLMGASESLDRKTAPAEVMQSLSRRTTDATSRKVVVSYLKQVSVGA